MEKKRKFAVFQHIKRPLSFTLILNSHHLSLTCQSQVLFSAHVIQTSSLFTQNTNSGCPSRPFGTWPIWQRASEGLDPHCVKMLIPRAFPCMALLHVWSMLAGCTASLVLMIIACGRVCGASLNPSDKEPRATLHLHYWSLDELETKAGPAPPKSPSQSLELSLMG